MVREQTGTKMGSMYVEFTANDKDLTIKLSNIKDKMQSMSKDTKSAHADFTRFAKAAGTVAASLAAIGISVCAITALATHSPALAGAMATIAINTFGLGQILGQQVAPIFEKIGQELIPSIGEAIMNLDPQISWLVDTVSQGVSDMSSAIKLEFGKIQNLGPKTAFVLGFAAGGFALGGVKGAFLGMALGYALENMLIPESTPEQLEKASTKWETGIGSKVFGMEGDAYAETQIAADRFKESFMASARLDESASADEWLRNFFMSGLVFMGNLVQDVLFETDKKKAEMSLVAGTPRTIYP